VDALQEDWKNVKWEESEGSPHGEGSNLHWNLKHQTTEEIVIECVYPSSHSIERLVRTIRPDPSSPSISLELEVIPRNDCKLPIGLHPTFKLEDTPGTTILKPGNFQFGMTFAGNLEPSSITKPSTTFKSLDQVPLNDGSTLDFSKLPISEQLKTENLLQLCGIDGHFTIEYTKQKFTVQMDWDATHYPSVLLWLSNRGRPAYPWNDRWVGVGIEPVCAAFDLGTHVSQSSNPINQRGVNTVIEFKKGTSWKTKYKLSAHS